MPSTPANTSAIPGQQGIRAQANGGPVEEVVWRPDGRGRVDVTLAFIAEAHETPLQIDLELDHPGQPSASVAQAAESSFLSVPNAKRILKRVLLRSSAAVGLPLVRAALLSSLRVSSGTRHP